MPISRFSGLMSLRRQTGQQGDDGPMDDVLRMQVAERIGHLRDVLGGQSMLRLTRRTVALRLSEKRFLRVSCL